METDTERTGVGPQGKSIDIWPVWELVINPPFASPSVVASVYGAAAVVPSATAVAAAKPAAISGAGKGLGHCVRRRQVPQCVGLPEHHHEQHVAALGHDINLPPNCDRTISCF
jgi:hypothetical protein